MELPVEATRGVVDGLNPGSADVDVDGAPDDGMGPEEATELEIETSADEASTELEGEEPGDDAVPEIDEAADDELDQEGANELEMAKPGGNGVPEVGDGFGTQDVHEPHASDEDTGLEGPGDKTEVGANELEAESVQDNAGTEAEGVEIQEPGDVLPEVTTVPDGWTVPDVMTVSLPDG